MDLEEIIKLADHLVFTETGKHLDDLQQSIIRETFQKKPYTKIAKDRNCTEGHIKTIASDLWKILSDTMGEKIRKSNVKAAIERLHISNFSNHNQDCIQITELTFCSTPSNPPETVTPSPVNTANPRIDLGTAPEITSFYGRVEELETLENWIVKEQVNLITILGITGIGKTTLARRLIEQIKGNFDLIIWRSLHFNPSLETTLKTLLQIISNEPENLDNIDAQLSQLLQYFRQKRCLVILDDLDTLFIPGQLAGQYQPDQVEYGTLLKAIATTSHKSCCLLLSREKPKEMNQLESEKASIRVLELQGLGNAARGIIADKGLKDEENWSTLIEIYQGHPLWLELIVQMIQELFKGQVGEFLSYQTLFIDDSLGDKLAEQFNRLSPLEKQIVYCFKQENQALTLSEIMALSKCPFTEVITAIKSLSRRCFIHTINKPETLYKLDPLLQNYYLSNHP